MENVKKEDNMLVGILSVYVSNLSSMLKTVKNKYNVLNRNVFVFKVINQSQTEQYVLTFNVKNGKKLGKQVIPVHRKKQNNVLFTINALNIIKDENENVEWQKYKDCLLVTNFDKETEQVKLKVIKLEKVKTVNLDLL